MGVWGENFISVICVVTAWALMNFPYNAHVCIVLKLRKFSPFFFCYIFGNVNTTDINWTEGSILSSNNFLKFSFHCISFYFICQKLSDLKSSLLAIKTVYKGNNLDPFHITTFHNISELCQIVMNLHEILCVTRRHKWTYIPCWGNF